MLKGTLTALITPFKQDRSFSDSALIGVKLKW